MASGNDPVYPPPPDMGKKGYPDAPPPYAPPTGGTPYPPTSSAMPGGYAPPPQPGFVYPQTTNQPGVVVATVQTGPVLMGNCPNCRVGVLSEDFSLCGILMAFFFFPIGIICCLMMRERRCNRCGSVFA